MWCRFGMAALALIGEVFGSSFTLLLLTAARGAAELAQAVGLAFALQLVMYAVILAAAPRSSGAWACSGHAPTPLAMPTPTLMPDSSSTCRA